MFCDSKYENVFRGSMNVNAIILYRITRGEGQGEGN